MESYGRVGEEHGVTFKERKKAIREKPGELLTWVGCGWVDGVWI
jgi:hypothetical protein